MSALGLLMISLTILVFCLAMRRGLPGIQWECTCVEEQVNDSCPFHGCVRYH